MRWLKAGYCLFARIMGEVGMECFPDGAQGGAAYLLNFVRNLRLADDDCAALVNVLGMAGDWTLTEMY